MDKKEIIALLKKRAKEYINSADIEKNKKEYCSKDNATWYNGRARGILDAIEGIGMLDKANNKTSLKQNDQRTS